MWPTKPYQIDRMLMQLKLAGKFKGVRGIVFGEMLDCVQTRIKATRWKKLCCASWVIWECRWLMACARDTCPQEISLCRSACRLALTVRDGGVSLKILEAAVTRLGRRRS